MGLLTLFWSVSFVVGFVAVLVAALVQRYNGKRSLKPAGRVLLITAHPDDECMFLAPSIISLTQAKVDVYLLCLSEGNYYGQGHVRKRELLKSAAVLGIKEDHVKIVDDRELPDDPKVEWNGDSIAHYIKIAVARHGIQTIMTFDEKGVSHHPNHVAISRAVRKLHRDKAINTDVYFLETVNIIRKYSGWLDVWLTVMLTRDHVSLNWDEYIKAQKAMQMHKSQYVWFRRLYVLFSRYMITNSFKRL